VTIERLNPPGLHQSPGYHHVTVVDAGRTAYLAGQCPLDETGHVVGGDATGGARRGKTPSLELVGCLFDS